METKATVVSPKTAKDTRFAGSSVISSIAEDVKINDESPRQNASIAINSGFAQFSQLAGSLIEKKHVAASDRSQIRIHSTNGQREIIVKPQLVGLASILK